MNDAGLAWVALSTVLGVLATLGLFAGALGAESRDGFADPSRHTGHH